MNIQCKQYDLIQGLGFCSLSHHFVKNKCKKNERKKARGLDNVLGTKCQ